MTLKTIDVHTPRTYILSMKFEWDDEKNKVNIRKHRIDFADVPPVFDGPMFTVHDTRREYGEDRIVGIGLLHSGVIVVVYVEKHEDIIRIISARKAKKHERETFENEIPD